MTKKMYCKIFILLIGLIIYLCGNSFPVFATESFEENLGENPEDSIKQEIIGGYIDIDDPLELDIDSNSSVAKEVLPASYDGRLNGRISSVKNQNPYGTCWAFSVMGAAETQMLINSNKEYDFSELQLIYFAFHHSDDVLGLLAGDSTTSTNYLGEGSTNLSTIFALSSWIGVGAEEKFPYNRIDEINENPFSVDTSLAYDDILHIDEAEGVGMKYSDSIKSMIMEYGSVVSAIYMTSESNMFNAETNALYSNITSANHSILVIGWDDNYSKENFAESFRPNIDGAWLIKNSWGNSKPYIWVSYEDACISKQNGFAYRFKEAECYDYNYQHDGSLSTHYENVENGSTLANVYKVSGSDYEELKAVSFALRSSNVNYSIQIYKNPEEGNPLSGEAVLVSPITGNVRYAGFHTVDLDEHIVLKQGETFAVAVTLTGTGEQISFYADASGTLYDKYGNAAIVFTNNTEDGQSFLCRDASVIDLGKCNPVGNSGNPTGVGYSARIKAYTQKFEKQTIDIGKASVSSVSTQIYKKASITPDVSVRYNGEKLIRDKDYELTYSNNIKIGTATIKITGKGDYVGEKEIKFKIVAKKNFTTIYKGVDYKLVYDYNYYISHNYSLWKRFNNDDKVVLEYFVKTGMRKGHRAKDSFDVVSYANQYYDLRNLYKNDLKQYYMHYINFGKKEGRIAKDVSMMSRGQAYYQGVNYKYVFHVGYYAKKYPELQKQYGFDDQLYLKHFVNYGMKEARQGCKGFNVKNYRSRYSDLRKLYGLNYQMYYLHYINFGKKEGRNGK